MTEKLFLTTKEAAELLGISTSSIYHTYQYREGFPVIRRGRLRFPREKLVQWWENPKNR